MIIDDRMLQVARDTANAMLVSHEALQGKDVDDEAREWMDVGIELGFAALMQALVMELEA